ncbi:MAG: S41 family peptidase, partial [Patescibacteria group bacterium]|nr:S41 family peptidase [Patescibacteria group bacterium]
PAVFGQQTTISIRNYSPEVERLLEQGYRLESEGRWGEALSHYEDAIRKFAGEESLLRRFENVRVHYDLGRRLADRSFSQTVRQLPLDRAIGLYEEVLHKIEGHYVETPKWQQLVERGAEGLRIALDDPEFAARNLGDADSGGVELFRDDLGQMLASRSVQSRYEAVGLVSDIARQGEARMKAPPAAIVLEFLCGATNALDTYSAYLTSDQLGEVYAQIDGNFVGLGIELKMDDGRLLIVRVITGSPAQEAGIRAGDHIITVDGRPITGLNTDQAANLLLGEEGSVVLVSIVTAGQPARELTVRRRRVDVPSVDRVEMVDSSQGIAYLQINCFQKATARDLEAALWKLHRQGMRRLIIDLRGNPGGLLTTAVDAADLFLDRGLIVSTRGRNAQEDFTYAARTSGTWSVPLVVLIDENSASAAEIFAGAIRDHRRGTLVGSRTYGKGSVQGIFPLSVVGAGVRLTTARFYSPMGRPFNRVGVEPDVAVHATARPVDGNAGQHFETRDAVLDAGVQIAQRVGAPR